MGKGRDKRRRSAKRTTRMRAIQPHPQRSDSVDPLDPDAHVLAPIKPKPSRRSGAVALPEPKDEEDSFFAEIKRTYG